MQKRYFIQNPEGEQSRIGAVTTVYNGTTPSRSRSEYWDGDIPWLPTGKVNERSIQSADEFITQKALSECSLSLIPSGATLVAMIGQGQTRGKVARLEIEACINQNFGAIVPTEAIDSWYLYFQMDTFYEHLRRWSHGTNQHALNCSLIREFPIWLPKLERQQEIAAELCQVDSALSELQQRYMNGERLLVTLREESLASTPKQSTSPARTKAGTD